MSRAEWYASGMAAILGRVRDWAGLRDELRAEALRRGWAALGVTGMEPFEEARSRGLASVRSGRMDGMPWMTAARMAASADLGARLPWARCLVALAWPYRPAPPPAASPTGAGALPRGRLAAYACLPGDGGDAIDYHDLLGRRCDELVDWLRARAGEVRAKRFIDHGWAMDRAIAERAGIGFTGKHAGLLTGSAGSYVLLGQIALSLPLPPDRPSAKGCGRCAACLPACPTGAIIAPGVIDARRCISYLTIEHQGPIPTELRPLVGTWVFGCDLCQEACPINHRRAPEPMAAPAGRPAAAVPDPDLVALLEMDGPTFASAFAGTSVLRSGRERLARNAAVALGNAGSAATLPALRRAAATDPDPVVREAAEWAVARVEAAAVSGSVEEPDRRAGTDRDRGADARRHERDRVVLRRPPGARQGTAGGNA